MSKYLLWVFLGECLLTVSGRGIPTPTSPQTALRFIKEVEQKSSKQERDVLRTLLNERRHWHPKAPQLLEQVAGRRPYQNATMRRLSGECDWPDQTTCDAQNSAECVGCIWKYGSCYTASCSDYDTQGDCCANAKKVEEGCEWIAEASSGSGRCARKECSDATSWGVCSDFMDNTCTEAQTVCGRMEGCTMTCNGCQDSTAECTCDGSSSFCTGGDLEGAMNTMMDLLSCPPMDCSLCMKDATTESEKIAMFNGACSARCSGVAHCEDEIKCLINDDSSGSGAGENCNAFTPTASCDQKLGSSSGTTTTPVAATCSLLCQAFDADCQASCGPPASCDSSGGVSWAGGRVLAGSSIVAFFGLAAAAQ